MKATSVTETGLCLKAAACAAHEIADEEQDAWESKDEYDVHVQVSNGRGSFYGLTTPADLQESGAGGLGLSFTANATVSFSSATYDDPVVPSFPQAYGFDILLLVNGFSAKSSAPFPD